MQIAHLLSILNYSSIPQLSPPQKTPIFAPKLSLPLASQQQSSHAQTSVFLWCFTRQPCNITKKHIWGTLCHLQALLLSFSEIQCSFRLASIYLSTTLAVAKLQPSLQNSSQTCPDPKLPLTSLLTSHKAWLISGSISAIHFPPHFQQI